MKHPSNVATPLITCGGVVQVNAAPEGPPARPRVTTVVLSVMTTLPPASSTETTGGGANTTPCVAALLGSVVNTSFAAGPTVTSKVALSLATPPAVARRWEPGPALSMGAWPDRGSQ